MRIQRRLALLLALLLLGFVGALWILRGMARSEMEQMMGTERPARSQLLTHWIDATSRELPQFVADAAQSAEFAQLIASPDAAARKKISADLETNGNAALWIVRADGTPRLEFVAANSANPVRLPVAREELAQVITETPNAHVFALEGA